jgi:hypothetical protein
MNRKQILAIENEVISSMTNNGAKERISRMYKQTKDNGRKMSSTQILNAIQYYIRMGYSSISKDELFDLYNLKMYNKRNGDENEDENYITPYQK